MDKDDCAAFDKGLFTELKAQANTLLDNTILIDKVYDRKAEERGECNTRYKVRMHMNNESDEQTYWCPDAPILA